MKDFLNFILISVLKRCLEGIIIFVIYGGILEIIGEVKFWKAFEIPFMVIVVGWIICSIAYDTFKNERTNSDNSGRVYKE